MKIRKEQKGTVVSNEGFMLNNNAQIMDILGKTYEADTNKVLISHEFLHEDFYNLKTQFAGEVLQKFSN